MVFTKKNAKAMGAKGQAAKKARRSGAGVLGTMARRKQMEDAVWYVANNKPSPTGKEKNELRQLLMDMKVSDKKGFMAYLRDWLPRPPKEAPLPAPAVETPEARKKSVGGEALVRLEEWHKNWITGQKRQEGAA